MHFGIDMFQRLYICLFVIIFCTHCVSATLDESDRINNAVANQAELEKSGQDSTTQDDMSDSNTYVVDHIVKDTIHVAVGSSAIDLLADLGIQNDEGDGIAYGDHDLAFDPPLDQSQPVNPPTPRRIDGLPVIYDLSQAPQEHVNTLIRRAIDGLGIQDESAPQIQDKIFVNRFYIAWIDETGFYGKINGLWLLNGDVDNLEFVAFQIQVPSQDRSKKVQTRRSLEKKWW